VENLHCILLRPPLRVKVITGMGLNWNNLTFIEFRVRRNSGIKASGYFSTVSKFRIYFKGNLSLNESDDVEVP
jgi:hypothetical protein